MKQLVHSTSEYKFFSLTLNEKTNALFILLLSSLVLLFSYFCLSRGITVIFMHLYYLPIILLAYNYQKKGVILSAILGALYVAMVVFFTYPDSSLILGALIRWCVFLLIAVIIAVFSIYLDNRQKEYETLFQSAESCILVVQRPGMQILDINPCGLSLMGYQKEEIVGKHFPNFCLEQKTSDEKQSVNLNPDAPNDQEFHFTTKNGDKKVSHLSVGEIPNNRLVITITDLTWRKEAEEALAKSEKKFRGVAERSSDLIILTGLDGKAFYVSPSVNRILGWQPEEVAGKKPEDFIHPDDLFLVEKKTTMDPTVPVTEKSEVRLRKKSGDPEYAVLEMSATPIIDDRGVRGLQILGRDITERKRIELALIASERRYRDLFNNASDQIIVHLISDKGPGRIIETNNVTCAALHYSRDEMLALNVTDIIKPAPPEEEQKMVEEIKRCGRATFEREGIRKDGMLFPVEISTHIFNDNGELWGISIARDISERKKAERALKEVNKKLNLLSGITRHDIINQVSAAQMFVDIIEMDGGISPDSKTMEDLKTIEEALKTIERQIVFTRDYQDLGIHSPEWFQVGELVETVSSGISENLIVENKVKSLEIYVDPLFERVIYNLFDNAIRHGKTITTISFTSEEINGVLKLICEDDGVGVPADVKEKIFNRQYYQHTGLGLFLSREILSITGMTIAETGVPGEGARFEILVPDGMWRKN